MSSTIVNFRDRAEEFIREVKQMTKNDDYNADEEENEEEDYNGEGAEEDDKVGFKEDDDYYDDEEDDDEEDDHEEDDNEEDDNEEDDEEIDDDDDDAGEEEHDEKQKNKKEEEEPESDDEDDYEDRSKKWNEEDKQVYILSEQNPNSIQMFTHNPYYYLTDAQTRLSPDIEILNSNPIEYFLHIYILCNNTNFDPYLACLLKYDDQSKSFTFPKIRYEPLTFKDGETHDVYIKNMCFEIIYPLFQIEEMQVTSEFIEHTKDCFKGSMFYEGMKHGYLCFNAEKFIRYLRGDHKNLSEHFHKEEIIPGYTWACMYEITINQRVHTIPIHTDVIHTFQEYDWLKNIKNRKNENTEIPMMLNSCKIIKNKIDYNLTELEKSKYLPPVSYNSRFERARFFTNESSADHTFQMPRYIVFLGKVKVIEDDITKKTDLLDKENSNINSIKCTLGNTTLYGVFSSDCIYNF